MTGIDISTANNIVRHIIQSELTLTTVTSFVPSQKLPPIRSLKNRFMVPIHGISPRAFPDIHSSFISSLQMPPVWSHVGFVRGLSPFVMNPE